MEYLNVFISGSFHSGDGWMRFSGCGFVSSCVYGVPIGFSHMFLVQTTILIKQVFKENLYKYKYVHDICFNLELYNAIPLKCSLSDGLLGYPRISSFKNAKIVTPVQVVHN